MTKTYVALHKINLTLLQFTIDIGDVLVYDPQNQCTLSVYRGEKLMKSGTFPPITLGSMVTNGMITPVEDEVVLAPETKSAPDPTPEQEMERRAASKAASIDDTEPIKDAINAETATTEVSDEVLSPPVEITATTPAATVAASETNEPSTEPAPVDVAEAPTVVEAATATATASTTQTETLSEAAGEAPSPTGEVLADTAAPSSIDPEAETTPDSESVDITKLSRAQLVAHGLKYFGIKLDKSQSKDALITEIRKAESAARLASVTT